jgi:ribosome-associated protein
MDIRKLQRAIVDGLEDVKAHDIRIYNTEHLSPLFERVIVASGTSNRQTMALAASVRDAVKSRGLPLMSVEGEDNGEWIIVDCGAAVAHIMQPAIRQYYNLEEIWGGKAVNMKLGAAAGFPARARAGADGDAMPAPTPATSASSAGRAAKRPAKSVAGSRPTPAPAAARGPAARKPAAVKPAAVKPAAVKPAAGKSSGGKAKSSGAKAPATRRVANAPAEVAAKAARSGVKTSPRKSPPTRKSSPARKAAPRRMA